MQPLPTDLPFSTLTPPPLKIDQAGSTPVTVLPVAEPPELSLIDPIPPANSNDTAGLPALETEGATETVTPMSFKLSSSVVRSIKDTVRELNEATPGHTPHSYGVEILSRHLELRQAATRAADLLRQGQDLEAQLSTAQTQLRQEQRRVLDLTAQLKAARDYAHRQEHYPTPSQVPPPVLPQPMIAMPSDELEEKYNTLLSRYEQSKGSTQVMESELAQLKGFIKHLPAMVRLLAQEASANSWYTQAYYEAFFHDLVTGYSQKIHP